jgi:uncharacterized integral membrane protein
MLQVFLAVILGVVFSIFATQNTNTTSLTMGTTTLTDIPLYLVALGALLVGLAIASLISIADSIVSSIDGFARNREIKQTYQTADQLSTRVHELEIENARLRGEQEATPQVAYDQTEHVEYPRTYSTQPSFFERMKNRLSF